MPFWTKEKWAGPWDFRGNVGNPQEDEKEQTRGEQALAGPAGVQGTQEEVQ